NGRAVHVSLWIAVKTAGGERNAGRGIFVTPGETEHKLIGSVKMRLRDAAALVEPDQCNGGAGSFVAPKHLFMHALERLLPPRDRFRLDENFVELGRSFREHAVLSIPVIRGRRQRSAAASPESITTDRGYGFRALGLHFVPASPRNDTKGYSSADQVTCFSSMRRET